MAPAVPPAPVAAAGPAATLLVLVALAFEARALGAAFPGAAPLAPRPGLPPAAGFVWAPAPGRAVVVMQTGMGAQALGEAGVARAIGAARPAGVLAVGFAGGVDPSLAVGDVVIGDPVVDPTVPGHWWPAVGLASRAAAAARRARLVLRAGPVLSVSKVEATPAAKTAVARTSPVLAIDMESACVARAAAAAGVPFLAVRVISDAAGDRLPDEPWRLVSPEGGTSLHRALRYLLRRPLATPTLVRTGLRARRAAAALSAFAAAWREEAEAPPARGDARM